MTHNYQNKCFSAIPFACVDPIGMNDENKKLFGLAPGFRDPARIMRIFIEVLLQFIMEWYMKGI